MALSDILATIDNEIAILQQARTVLSGGTAAIVRRSPGRPRKVAVAAVEVTTKPARKKKRNLTPEGRKRIAEAVKRRWAAQRKAAAK